MTEKEAFELFEKKQFWEAHEALEDIWRESSGDQRLFYQAWIQICAAFLKENFPQARERLFLAAKEKWRQCGREDLVQIIDRRQSIKDSEMHRQLLSWLSASQK